MSTAYEGERRRENEGVDEDLDHRCMEGEASERVRESRITDIYREAKCPLQPWI